MRKPDHFPFVIFHISLGLVRPLVRLGQYRLRNRAGFAERKETRPLTRGTDLVIRIASCLDANEKSEMRNGK
jgi:hypothetical protein